MHVRWTPEALGDLDDIVDFVERQSTEAAQRIAAIIVNAAEGLEEMPHRGRLGVAPGTRELIIVSIGYIMTYEVLRDAVFILRIDHGAQDRPRR